MKNERLFEAIGGLDDSIIAETETVSRKRSGRIMKRTLLVAALVAGLAISAGAAPLIRNALLGGKLETSTQPVFLATDPATGKSPELRSHKITLKVEFNEDAPKSIETYYITPDIPVEYKQYRGHIYKDEMCAQFGWIVEGAGRDIFFSQTAGNAVQPGDLVVSVHTAPGQMPEHGLRTFAGIQGYLVDEPTVEYDYGKREFYWSDGDYLFCLQVPIDYTDAQLEQMVASVRPVEDITPYLSTMTDQEVGEIFGQS